ncbi:hypothetical protein CN97_00715 [Haematobacter massiliensis]|uniref:Uncharacterized protein n=1 Tax=Haematobacter massiliensis TaxID=195105 RepID=A0A086Y0I4_9RHOB|nr:hypothetical protein [Haematobacter massiliensis]KFI27784.1 hypothetical protein CN97_00715 [Haematobacter massiliensis]OWJ82707.1 hypothetical protein CDV51_17010 [Haematobacter massiliensis]
MVNVYAWPPVGFRSFEWSVDQPVAKSRSLWSNRRYISTTQRRRRVATISVSAGTTMGAGYMEALKRLLEGGTHLVRLDSFPLNPDEPEFPDGVLNSEPFEWLQGSGPDPLGWQALGGELRWFNGPPVSAVSVSPSGAIPAWVEVSGLPPSQIIAMPGQFVTIYYGDPELSVTRMIMAPVISDASGVAIVKIEGERPANIRRVHIGTQESSAFEALSIPRAPRVVNSDWFYDWSFLEVFEDETAGFVEVDPWS